MNKQPQRQELKPAGGLKIVSGQICAPDPTGVKTHWLACMEAYSVPYHRVTARQIY